MRCSQAPALLPCPTLRAHAPTWLCLRTPLSLLLGPPDPARVRLHANADFKDFDTIRKDPDLAPLGQQLTELVARYDNPMAQVCGCVSLLNP